MAPRFAECYPGVGLWRRVFNVFSLSSSSATAAAGQVSQATATAGQVSQATAAAQALQWWADGGDHGGGDDASGDDNNGDDGDEEKMTYLAYLSGSWW